MTVFKKTCKLINDDGDIKLYQKLQRRYKLPVNNRRLRINEWIRVPQVRLIGTNGDMIGIKPTYEALNMARSAGLDLVEIAPNANPPVCKIMDFSKYLYEKEKQEKENRKKQRENVLKEIRINPRIAINDLETKIRHMEEFLKKGDKVRVTIVFHGREAQHKELGEEILNKIKEKLLPISEIDGKLVYLGNRMSLMFKQRSSLKK